MRFISGLDESPTAPLKHLHRSTVLPFRRLFRELPLDADPRSLRQQLREFCPASPGVYAYLDGGRVIYVGVSSKLRKRLITYFQGGASVRKEHAVAGQATKLMWQVVGHEFVAQLRELELIRRCQPRLNVRGRWPGRPLGYIYLSKEDAPRFRVARRVPKGVRYYWGPMPMGWRIRDAVELVNQVFKLCDCPSSVPMHFADQRNLFAMDLRLECLRGETGSCLGPCAAHCTFTDYSKQLSAARAFLNGRDDAALTELEHRLAAAAARQHFEQAARLRDKLDSLRTLADRLERLRKPAAPSEFIYPLTIGRREVWLYVARGAVAASSSAPVASAPSASVVSRRCVERLDSVYDARISQTDDADRLGAQIVSSWFYTRPGEAANILSPDEARKFCQTFNSRP